MRDGADVNCVLDEIARTVSHALGFETVVLNVYRPEWDDLYVAAVHGHADVRGALLGSVYGWEEWRPLLHERFNRGGAYFIPHGALDWDDVPGDRFVPDGQPAVSGPDGWHPADELFVPLERADGQIIGVMSFGEPVDGLRPTDEDLAVAVALATHATLALETAEERDRLNAHQRGLEELLRVSSQLPQTVSTEAMLTSVCRGIRDALGFARVMVHLVDATSSELRPFAACGWEDDHPARTTPLALEEIRRLLDAEFEIAGCYLVPNEEAQKRVDSSQVVYASELNGRGPHAWNHHWLIVPLYSAEGEIRGMIWADEPTSRLLPSEPVLQALRIFGNHAMEALAAATQLAETRFLAENDSLTRLHNRRALVRELSEAAKTPQRRALVFLDLDNFKEINDGHGHTVGDRVLERFAAYLQELVRAGDAAFRVGGDEFALLLHGAGEAEARDVVARVVEAVSASSDPMIRTLSASFGIATSRFDGDAEEMLRVADEAMYEAKRAGTQVEVAA